ncbi:MAG: hypothetical protein RTU30_12030 [Candidatus Thorarchaeota archaeon]
MNRLSHMVLAFSLFVGLYTIVWGLSVWQSDVGEVLNGLAYYFAGGLALSFVAMPILYYKAPHKDKTRTTSDMGAYGAMFFVCFCIGSMLGMWIYQTISGVAVIGNPSLFIGGVITVTGALMPDWDIPLLGIGRHRNLVFHSVILPFLVVAGIIGSTLVKIIAGGSLLIEANVELYIGALFLIGYASHLYADIYPSDANFLEIVWRSMDPNAEAPTGLKSLGPIKVSKKQARNWLGANATLLLMVAAGLLGLYFYNILVMP